MTTGSKRRVPTNPPRQPIRSSFLNPTGLQLGRATTRHQMPLATQLLSQAVHWGGIARRTRARAHRQHPYKPPAAGQPSHGIQP